MEKIEEYLDFVLRNIDNRSTFSVNNILLKHDDFSPEPKTDEEKLKFHNISDHVKEIGINSKYFHSIEKDRIWFKLSDLGRRVIDCGGHKEYLKKIESENTENKTRQTKIDEINRIDLLNKRFRHSSRYWPYYFSLLSLIMSLNLCNQQANKNIEFQNFLEDMDSLKNRIHKLDSLVNLTDSSANFNSSFSN